MRCALTAVYQCIVQALYNIQLVQAITAISCKFSTDEHNAWRAKGRTAGCSRLEALMSQVVELLCACPLYDDDNIDQQVPAVSLR